MADPVLVGVGVVGLCPHGAFGSVCLLCECDRLRAKVAALAQENDRLRHGTTVEGDFVCPNAQLADEAKRMRRELQLLRRSTYAKMSGSVLRWITDRANKILRESRHWPDCAVNHGALVCDMGPDCGLTREEMAELDKETKC